MVSFLQILRKILWFNIEPRRGFEVYLREARRGWGQSLSLNLANGSVCSARLVESIDLKHRNLVRLCPISLVCPAACPPHSQYKWGCFWQVEPTCFRQYANWKAGRRRDGIVARYNFLFGSLRVISTDWIRLDLQCICMVENTSTLKFAGCRFP